MARHDMNLPSLIMANGYSISYDHDRNQIVIGLPQTNRSLTTTVLPVRNRNEVTIGLLNTLLALTTAHCEAQAEGENNG